jgi:hypothetical protein
MSPCNKSWTAEGILKKFNITYIFFLPLRSHFGAQGWFLSFSVYFCRREDSLDEWSARHLNTGQHKHRINIWTCQTSVPYVGFEPTIPASERAKTVHALDRSHTVTGIAYILVVSLKFVVMVNMYIKSDRNAGYCTWYFIKDSLHPDKAKLFVAWNTQTRYNIFQQGSRA